MSAITERKITELVPGDVVINKGREIYTVVEIVRNEPDEFIARVQWVDGGYDIRVWAPEHFEQKVDIIHDDTRA